MIDFLNDAECKIIWDAWMKWHSVEGSSFDALWFGYSDLSDQTRIDVKKLKKFIKVLRDGNIAYSSSLWSEEGMLRGKGNFIHDKYLYKPWDEIKIILDKDKI